MPCEPQKAVIDDLLLQLPAVIAAVTEAANRMNTWALQYDAALAAYNACMASQNSPPPGP